MRSKRSVGAALFSLTEAAGSAELLKQKDPPQVYDAGYTIFEQNFVEIYQQPKRFVGRPKIREQLFFVQRPDLLDRFQLNHHHARHRQVHAEAMFIDLCRLSV
ncbi:hypothetical protein K1V27_19570 [Syntrophobacteraceae bacterium DRH4]|nr:hypothetical protein [Desulfoferrobacter suflitae]MCK8603906.1 hypothetical protein [Desulfoferrobacter suflitae]